MPAINAAFNLRSSNCKGWRQKYHIKFYIGNSRGWSFKLGLYQVSCKPVPGLAQGWHIGKKQAIGALSQSKVRKCSGAENVPVSQQLKNALHSQYSHWSHLQKDSDAGVPASTCSPASNSCLLQSFMSPRSTYPIAICGKDTNFL